MNAPDKTEERLEDFRCIVAGLAQDAGIRVEVSAEANWSFDPVRGVVLVPESGLRDLGTKACAGILAHEIGHYYLSRYHLFAEVDRLTHKATRVFLNAIEDARTDHFMRLRYPGVRAWRWEAISAAMAMAPPPCAFLQYCASAAVAPYVRDACLWPDSPYYDDVNKMLFDTKHARELYLACVPESGAHLDVDEPGLRARYEREVPMVPPVGLRPRDMKVLIAARRAFDVFLDQLLEAILPLIEADAEPLGRLLPEDDEATLSAAGTAPLVGGKALSAREQHMTLHLEAMDRVAKRLREAASVSEDDEDDEDDEDVEEAPAVSYDRVAAKMAPQSEALMESLVRSLPPSRRSGRGVSMSRFGQRADLNRVLAFHADPRADRVWIQHDVLNRRSAAAALVLVDVSGSMRAKIEPALDCAVMIAEAFETTGLRWALAGFQDEVLWVHGFEDPFDEAAKRRIEAMALWPFNKHPSGKNHAGFNDDGPCLLQAAARLSERTEWRILLVVSDGQPAGRRSNPKDLHRAVRTIHDRGLADVLVGIGVGPDTKQVENFYPWGFGDVPTEEVAQKIASVLHRAVTARLLSRG